MPRFAELRENLYFSNEKAEPVLAPLTVWYSVGIMRTRNRAGQTLRRGCGWSSYDVKTAIEAIKNFFPIYS